MPVPKQSRAALLDLPRGVFLRYVGLADVLPLGLTPVMAQG